ncbi:MAG: CHAT domain-containing protein [Myxococcales bacterium]|nr:CHAT domain-containing protein [Myxococcales bacterium]
MILVLLSAAAFGADPCEAGLAAALSAPTAETGSSGDRYEAWRCFYMSARKIGRWQDAEARLSRGRAGGDVWAEVVLGHVYSDQGDARAEVHYRAALDAFERSGERVGSAQARFGLANYLWHSGAGAAAPRALLGGALADAEATGDPLLVATARAQVARHLWRTAEDFGEAYTLARQAERAAFPAGSYQLRLLVLHVLAGVCTDTGRLEEGVAIKARLVDLVADAGDTYVEATARLNLADAWLMAPWLAPTGGALAEAERALAAATRAGNRYSEAGARCVLGRARGPDASTAIADWTACADGYAALGDPEAEGYGRMGLAVALRVLDPLGAAALIDETITRADSLGSKVRALDARFVAGELAWERGDRVSAMERSEALLRAIESLSDSQSTEADRAGLGARGAAAYDALASHQLDAGEVNAALTTVERLRGRLLLEALKAGGAGTVSSSQSPTTVSQIQALLAADEALVVYQISAQQTLFAPYAARSWALVLTSSFQAVVRLGDVDELASRARLFEALFARRDGSAALAGGALADDLVRPVEAALPPGIRRLVLVPDGPLLPFAALQPDVSLRAVSTVPSVAVWLTLRSLSPSQGAGGALALADASLPRAPAEAASVVSLLGGVVWQGPAASVDALLATDLAAYRVLYFAAHVTVDETHPDRSAVHLAGGEAGRLLPPKIVGLSLDGQLVVLSACSGANGRAVDGEGVMGVARSFLHAGARAVVASAWPLEDTEAEQVLTNFAGGLARGETVDVALQSAQLAAKEDGLADAAWAGLLVIGDGGWAPFPGGTPAGVVWPSWPLRLGLGAGLLAAGLALWRAVSQRA